MPLLTASDILKRKQDKLRAEVTIFAELQCLKMLEIFYDIKILQWGPGSCFHFIIPLYICDNVYNKPFGTCFCARKSKVRGTDEIHVDQERESHMGLFWGPTKCYICLVLIHFFSIFPKINYFLLVSCCNVDSKEQISSNLLIRSGLLKIDVQDTLQV